MNTSKELTEYRREISTEMKSCTGLSSPRLSCERTLRLILSSFFFEAVSYTKSVYKVEYEWWSRKKKIGLEKDV